MTLRPEFELLETQSNRLFWSKEIDSDFLKSVEDNIKSCEYIVETDIEKLAIERAKFWWKRRLSELDTNLDTGPKLLPPAPSEPFIPHKNEFIESDREILHSLDIIWDEPSGNNDDSA